MIRARDILEEFVVSFESQHENCEVFSNPDHSELRQIPSKILRFIADDHHKIIYVWNAHLAIHKEVAEKLHLPGMANYSDGFFFGEIIKREGSDFELVKEFSSEEMKNIFLFQPQATRPWKDILNRDWTWTRKYNIDLDTALNLYRNVLFIRPR